MSKTYGLNHYVDVQDIREDDVFVTIEATPEERVALAKRLKIPEVNRLTAEVTLKKGVNAILFDIEGHLQAEVVQECGVTLSPLKEVIDETFYETLTTSEAALGAAHEEKDEEARPVELIQNDRVELGEIISQWVGLSLDPYPRSDTPFFQHVEAETEGQTHKPFGVLESLKGK